MLEQRECDCTGQSARVRAQPSISSGVGAIRLNRASANASSAVTTKGTPAPIAHWIRSGRPLLQRLAMHRSPSEINSAGSSSSDGRKRGQKAAGVSASAMRGTVPQRSTREATQCNADVAAIRDDGRRRTSVWRRAAGDGITAASSAGAGGELNPPPLRKRNLRGAERHREAAGLPRRTLYTCPFRLRRRVDPSGKDYVRTVRQQRQGVVCALL